MIVAFLSPLLSGIADYLGNKKVFMKFFVFHPTNRGNTYQTLFVHRRIDLEITGHMVQ